jgi:putative ABC transport system substrate-binding protein
MRERTGRFFSPYSDIRKSAIHKRPRGLKWLGLIALFVGWGIAHAQQSSKIPRIGFLGTDPAAVSVRLDALRRGLEELGYAEGKTIAIEYRYAGERFDRFPGLAADLVSSKVEVIVTGGPGATRAAKNTTAKIPIVMAQDTDPVGTGFAASLARPGGNVTGLSTFAPELSGKQLELIKEIAPKSSRVAVLGNSTIPGNAQMRKEVELAAGALGLKPQFIDVQSARDVEPAFFAAKNGSADALLVLLSPVLNAERQQVVGLAAKHRLPVIYPFGEFVEAGGLVSYGVSIPDLYRRAATYVDKILKGVKPADLPVEQPKKFEFIVNLKAAKQIGLVIPPNVLVRANRVIR